MGPDTWARIKELLGDAIEKAPDEREAFLAKLAARDPAAAEAVRSLLKCHDEAGGEFLKTFEGAVPATSAMAPERPLPGPESRIGSYKVLSTLGEGGFGVVYLAEQTVPVRRRVALKVVKLGMDSREVVARFEAERQAVALMDHPNVAKVFDAGTTPEGRPYFAMEYVPGVPITDYCDQHRLTTRERLELFVQVCYAVQHAHQKGIIHRDLKPSNILVTVQDGRPVPKVIDFGVAKAISQQLTQRTLFTEQGRLIGTPEYMSPEQAGTTGLDVDTRTDVYSLGVIVYELLVGALPFASKTLRQAGYEGILRIIREKDPPKPSTRLSGLGAEAISAPAADRPSSGEPTAEEIASKRRADLRSLARELRGDLDWITMRALEKDRTRRYQTPAELADDVRRFLGSEPVRARPPSVGYRLNRFSKRHKFGVAAGAVITLALMTAATGTVVGLVHARVAEAQMKFERDEARAARVAAEFAAAAEREQRKEAQAQRELAEVQQREAQSQRELAEERRREAQAEREAAEEQRREAQAQRERAEREAEKYQAISDFLVEDLLGSATPERSLGRKVTVEEVLRNASERVGEAFAGKPEIETVVRTQIGGAFYRLGLYDDADPHWTAALELARREHGEEHEETVAAMANLALLRQFQGRLAEAEPLYAGCVELMRKLFGEEHPSTIKTLGNYAMFLYNTGKLDEAIRVGTEAVELGVRVSGEEDHDTVRINAVVAGALVARGRNAEAEEIFRRTLEIRRRTRGPDHPDTLISLGNLAAVIQKYPERAAETEELFRELVDAARRVMGEEHPNTLVWMGNFAAFLSTRGERSESEQLYRRTLEARRRVSGNDHPETAFLINAVAGVLAAQDKNDEAEAMYREALEIRRRVLPQGHHETAATLSALGNLCAKVGRHAEGEPLVREAVEIRAAALGETHPLTDIARSELGEILGALGRDSEAEPLLAQACESLAGNAKVRSTVKQEALDRLARFYEARGRAEDAAAARERFAVEPPVPATAGG